nr:hypothetical protein [Tanacetum cinerariifolium]
GALPSDTVRNPREEIKAITTQSGIVLDGPSVLPPLTFSSSKEVEQDPKTIIDQVPTESTIKVPPLIVQSHPTLVSSEIPHPHTLSSSELPKRNPRQPPIPYPSRLNKEKLQDNGLLKKLHEKLRDPGRFLIPCDFYGLESCMALADLGASNNLMPLSVWKKLSLLDLTPTRMTLELAIRSIACPAGIAEDVCVQVGKFTFSADFVVNDYDVDLRVPLILGRPFLRTARALVDVHGKELILRDGDENLIFHADSTSKHPHKHINESINMINFIDITCEDRFPEVDSILEEFVNELALSDPFPTGNEDDNFDLEADFRKIEYLLNQDPSTESGIEIIDPILERFTYEPALNYSPPPRDDDDDLFDLKSDNDEWKKLFDSTLPEESSEIATLSSSPFGNKDKVFNPGILNLGRTQIFNDESKDKDYKVNISLEGLLILKERNFLSISSDHGLLFHLVLTVIETLLSFSSENKDKVFNPGILTSKGVHSLTLELSHRTYETFKIVNIHLNIFNEEIPSGESKVHIEVLSVLWRNRLPIPDGSLPLSR